MSAGAGNGIFDATFRSETLLIGIPVFSFVSAGGTFNLAIYGFIGVSIPIRH